MRALILPALLLLAGCPEDVPAVVCEFQLPTPGRVPSAAGFNLLVNVKGTYEAEDLALVRFVSDVEATGSDYPGGVLLESGINVADGCQADGCPAGARLETAIAPGVHTITASALTPRGTAACSDSVEIRANTKPTITSITVLPASPSTDDTLSVTFTTEDADGDAVNVAASWTGPDGAAVSGETVAPLNTTAGDEWTVRLVPRDAYDAGVASEQAVSIANAAPGQPTVVVSPNPARENAPIRCQVTDLDSLDPDGEQTLTVAYSWLRDGGPSGESGAVLPPTASSAGETWTCEAVVSDGTAESPPGTAETTVLEALDLSGTTAIDSLPAIEGAIASQFVGATFRVGAPGDLTGDGSPDLVVSVNVGTAGGSRGHAYLFATAPGSTIDVTAFDTDFQAPPSVNLLGGWSPGDINGDGFADLVLPFRHALLPGAGDGNGVYIVFGRDEPFPASVDLATQAVRIVGGEDEVGQLPCPIGDLDGDGADELGVAAPLREGLTGRVYVVWGHAGAWPGDLSAEALQPSFRVDGGSSGHRLGETCGGPADFDLDGYADLVLSAPGAGSGGKGRVMVWRGSSERFAGTIGTANADVLIDGPSTGPGGFGSAMVALRDHDGDGAADLAVYAPGVDGGEADGAVWIASADDLAAGGAVTADLLSYTLDGDTDLGFCRNMAAADLDGDGLDDLVCGDLTPSEATTESVRVFLGGLAVAATRGTADADFAITGAGRSQIGASLVRIEDWDGDAIDDLAVGDPGDPSGGADAGAVFLLLSD